MNDYKIAIGIVLYNPNIEQLRNNIKELSKITKNIFFVDNNSKNKKDLKKVLKSYNVIYNEENKGIAKALNQLLLSSINKKMDYLLTLDQDSQMTLKCFNELFKYKDIENAAILCPTICDLNKKKNKTITNEYESINRCITSGCLMNLKYCKQLPFFDESMFIDYVDFDYCKNIIMNDYKIIQVRDAILKHEVGKRIKRKFLFWDVYPTNHSNLDRYYYYSRNIKYYLNKYKGNLTLKEYLVDEIFLIWKFVNVLLYEELKCKKIKMLIKGIKDSKKIIKDGDINDISSNCNL